MLMMRVTPKISDRPTATRKRPDAVESPLSAWKRKAERVIGASYLSPARGGWLREPASSRVGSRRTRRQPPPGRQLPATLPRERGRDQALNPSPAAAWRPPPGPAAPRRRRHI